MKNHIKLFGVIALAAVIGFSMTACDDGNDNGGGGGGGGGSTPSGITAATGSGWTYGHIKIDGFDIVEEDSTLDILSGTNPIDLKDSAGFSVTVDGTDTSIYRVRVVSTAINWQIYIRLVDIDYDLADGATVKVSYTPDGKNEFVNTSGKTLSSFEDLTATATEL